MSISRTTGVVISILMVAALIVGWYWFFQHTAPKVCRICQRPIHAHARAVIEVDGKREAVCCVHCALFEQRQQQTPVRLVQVTDYNSSQPLKPEEAYYVVGSRVIMCERHEPLMDQTKHPFERVFDRCVPSIFAFASRDDAQAFAAGNGGVVRRLPELIEEVPHTHD